MKLVDKPPPQMPPEEQVADVVEYVGEDLFRIWWVTSQALNNPNDNGTALACWQKLRLGVYERRRYH